MSHEYTSSASVGSLAGCDSGQFVAVGYSANAKTDRFQLHPPQER